MFREYLVKQANIAAMSDRASQRAETLSNLDATLRNLRIPKWKAALKGAFVGGLMGAAGGTLSPKHTLPLIGIGAAAGGRFGYLVPEMARKTVQDALHDPHHYHLTKRDVGLVTRELDNGA